MDPLIDNPNSSDRQVGGRWWQDFPALAELRLEWRDLELLTRQGFVATEDRNGRKQFKLRFRRGGKQVVRCIGNAAAAERVRIEIERLQRSRHAQLDLDRTAREAARLVRKSKTELAAILEARGFHFHGLTIRRRINFSI